MKINSNALRPALALLAVTFLFGAPSLRAAQPAKDSEEVNGLLADASSEAAELKSDAEDLNSFVHATITWESHAGKLKDMKAHFNKTSALVTKMKAAKASASPWQRQAIDRIDPVLVDLAASIETSIDHLSKNKDRLAHSPFPEYAAANEAYASDMAQLISDYVALGKAREKEEELTNQLEAPAK